MCTVLHVRTRPPPPPAPYAVSYIVQVKWHPDKLAGGGDEQAREFAAELSRMANQAADVARKQAAAAAAKDKRMLAYNTLRGMTNPSVQERQRVVKRAPWHCPRAWRLRLLRACLVTLDGSARLGTPRGENMGHCAFSQCLGCSGSSPPKSPIARPLTTPGAIHCNHECTRCWRVRHRDFEGGVQAAEHEGGQPGVSHESHVARVTGVVEARACSGLILYWRDVARVELSIDSCQRDDSNRSPRSGSSTVLADAERFV